MRISDWSSDVCSSDLACQITEALPAEDLFFVTTMDELPQRDGKTPFAIVADCNKNTPFRFLLCVGQAILCLLRQRPDVVISTGALPGFAFVMVAHVLRIRTIWVDSVANAEERSEEHTSEVQSLMRTSYAVFCLKKKKTKKKED